MPKILKGTMFPQVESYAFPDSADIPIEPDPVPVSPLQEEPEPEGEEEEAVQRPPEYHDPRTPVDYARLQAEVILAEANKQADALLEQCEQELAVFREAAKEEGRLEGYRAGYAEGVAKAREEAQEALRRQTTRLEVDVAHVLEEVGKAQERFIEETTDDLKELALAVAEKVVRVSLKSSGEVVARMIQGATEKLKRREWVHIYIAGCDAKSMAKIPPMLTSALSAVSDHVKIVPMADDEAGTCVIEMPDEIIDASASTQISNIRALLTDISAQDI